MQRVVFSFPYPTFLLNSHVHHTRQARPASLAKSPAL